MAKQIKRFDYVLAGDDINLVDKESKNIRYIKKKTFKDAADNGLEYSIVGRTTLKEEDEKNEKSDKKGILFAGDKKYIVDSYKSRRIKGYIPVGGNRYLEYAGIWFPLLWLIILGALGLLTAGLLMSGILDNNHDPIAPDWDQIQDEQTDDTEDKPSVVVDLPDGKVHYDGRVRDDSSSGSSSKGSSSGSSSNKGTSYYSGKAHITVTQKVEEDKPEHVVIDQDVNIDDGLVDDTWIDYPEIDYELKPGSHDGTVIIRKPGKEPEEEKVNIIIRQSSTGKMEFGFSDKVTVNKGSGAISMFYEPDKDATHDSVVQLILVKNGKEYLMAQSGRVKRGQTLDSMTLDRGMDDMITSGTYSGFLRLYFDADNMADKSAALNTDIEVKITVQ